MRFEYNGNLLEGRISENKKVSDELNRLYNIMLVYGFSRWNW